MKGKQLFRKFMAMLLAVVLTIGMTPIMPVSAEVSDGDAGNQDGAPPESVTCTFTLEQLEPWVWDEDPTMLDYYIYTGLKLTFSEPVVGTADDANSLLNNFIKPEWESVNLSINYSDGSATADTVEDFHRALRIQEDQCTENVLVVSFYDLSSAYSLTRALNYDNGSPLSISFDPWTDSNGTTYTVTNTENITLQSRALKPIYDYTVEQIGGVSGTTDTEGLLITLVPKEDAVFPDGFEPTLSASQVTINGTKIVESGGTGWGLSLTDYGDDDPLTWYIPNISTFLEDVMVRQKDGAQWTFGLKDGTNYFISGQFQHKPVEQEVTIYRKTINVTFTARQSGGSDGMRDSDSIEVVFSPTVTSGLLPDDITLTGAEISTASDAVAYTNAASSYFWSIDFAEGSLTAGNNETVRIDIDDWGPYHVTSAPVDVTVYTDYQIGENEGWTLVRLLEAKQIGGSMSQESRFGNVTAEWSDKTTEGILLRFNKAISLSNADITVYGATKGTLTNFEDDDPKTWYIPISEFYDQSQVYVYFATEEEGEDYYRITDPSYRLATSWEVVAVYKDIRPQVTYTLEQVGGVSGLSDSTELKLTITSTESMAGSGLHEGMVSLKGVSHNGFTSSISEDGTTIIWTYKLWGDWDDGATASVLIQSWTGNRTRYMADDTPATAAIYKDTRTYVNILSAKGAGGYETGLNAGLTGISYEGLFDDTSVEFTLSKSGDLGLSVGDITLLSPDGSSVATISDDDDALTYDAQKDVWRLKLDAVTGTNGINPFILSIADWNAGAVAYSVSNTGNGNLSNDNRQPIKLIAAEQVGGVADTADSTGILLTLSQDFVSSDSTSFDFLQKVALSVTGPTEQDTVSYRAEEVEGRPDQVLLKLNSLRYSGTKTFQVRLSDLPSHRSSYKVTDAMQSVDLHRIASSAEDGRTLESVMPRGIYLGSAKKKLTLSGILVGTHLSPMKEIRVREEGDEDTQNWVLIDLPYLRMELSNYTLDVSDEEIFNTLGDYEVSFTSYDNFASEWRQISVYDNPVYSQDGYGILAITQNSDKSFTLSPFEGESDMKAELGSKTPLVVFRGGVLKSGDNYQVQSGSVINNALTYFDSEGDDTLKVRKMPDGTIEIYAEGKSNGGELRWKNIPITARDRFVYGSNNFDIVLDDTTTYKTKRTASTGTSVEITTGVNDFSAQFVFGEVSLTSYTLYDGECAISGTFMLGLPDWLIGTAYAQVELHQLLFTNSIIPPINATGSVGMRPGGMLGDSVSDMIGGGEFTVEINTLPETNPRYIGASGNLDLASILYCEGELVLAWSEMGGITVLMPNNISFFARVKNGGVPLVPPTILAYINGFGGGVNGIAETLFGNFKVVPPLKVMAYGAVVDASGELFSVDKAEFKFGLGSISAYAREASILKLIKLEDVGYEYGITDSTIESVYGLPSVDTYFAFGGQMSVEALLLQISGGLNADVRLRGNYLSDALIDYTLACEKAGGFVTPSKSVKKALYNAVDFNGRIWASAKLDLGALGTLAGGTGELAISKTKLSGSVTGELWPDIRKKVGFTYNFKKNDLDFEVMRMAISGTYDKNIFEDGEVTVTNLIDAGSYQVRKDGWHALSLVSSGDAVPTAQKDQIATVYADQEYDWVDIVITPTDSDAKTIRLDGDLGWFETPSDYSERGAYSLNYLIPEEGKYQFATEGKADHSYWLTEFAELPEYTAVSTSVPASGTTLQTNWTLNETADRGDALLTRLLLVDAGTGDIALDLTAPEINVDDSNVSIGEYPLASVKTFTADLPETLESGRYYISAELLRKETEVVTLFEGTEDADTQEVTEYVTLSILRSAEFNYTNPDSPAAPTNIRTTYSGNGAFTVAWDSVTGADGYQVSILDSEGNEIPGITELNVTTNEFVTELPCEVMIQGGLVTTQEVLDDAGNILDEGGDQYGLEYGKTYQINVQAYKNITKSGATGEGEDEREYEYVLPILGLTSSIDYLLPTPQIPVLSVSLEGGNSIDGGEEGISYISTNSKDPTLIIGSSEAATINVYLNESQTPVYTSSSPETSHNVSLPLQEGDGIYNVRITANIGEDIAQSGMTISLDTVAPILNVDNDSFTAAEGQLILNGFTELGAAVTMNGIPLTLDGGLFYEETTVAQTGEMVELLAFDEAGNTTERIFNVVYEQTLLSPEVTITAPVTGQSPITTATGGSNFTVGSVSWTPADTLFKKTTQYTATLTLTADLGYTFTGMTEPTINGYTATVADNTGETVTLSYTFASTGENTLTGMELVSAPTKLSYIHGDTLDLSGMSVRLLYNDASEETVALADFESMNISTDPADGSALTASQNGDPIIVSCGEITVNAGTLTVEEADQEAPSAPTLSSKTETSIQLNTTAGYEYAYNTTNAAPASDWNTTGTFTGLTEYTQYYFFARKAQTEEYIVSPPSPGTAIKTADVTKPTAMVQYQTNDFDAFHNTNTYNLFFKDKADVTIRGADSGSGVNKTEYFKSNTPITDTETITRWVTGETFSVSTKEKFHLYVRVTDAEDNQSLIYFDSIVVYEDSEQDTASISYTKASAANHTAAVTLNGNTIDSIKNGTATLERGTDYSVSGDEITFNASYLEQLAEDDYELTIYYKPQGETYVSSSDNDAPVTTVIALTVTPEPHTHNFEGEWKSNATGHWQECSCGETSTVIAHTEGDEATCTTPQTCTVCSKVIVSATGHNYASEWSSDASDHWKECSICGDKDSVTAHTEGAAATCTTPQTCTVCGKVIVSATGHNYASEWSSDADDHWKECSICGDKDSVTAHTESAAATCTTPQTCTICNKVIVAATGHNYADEWRSDADDHWMECSICGDKDSVTSHTEGDEATCTTPQTCTVCDKVIVSATGHDYADEWRSDADEHWKECSICGDKDSITAHTEGTAATCTTPQTCTVCSKVIVAATGHNYASEWSSDANDHWKECSICGDKDYVTSHTEGTAATCTTPQTCTVCNKVIVSATGHNYASEWSSDANDHWKECSICGDKTSVTAHTSGDWIIDIPAAIELEGSRHKECTICSYITETETIPAIVDDRPVVIQNLGIILTAPVTGQLPNYSGNGNGNFSIGMVTWSPAHSPFLKNTKYTATVTLTANTDYTFSGETEATINGYTATVVNNTGETITLSYEFASTGENTLTGMELIAQPGNLSYTHGDTLDLTGLSVKLLYNDATEETVALADFESKNISTDPANESVITMSQNRTAITVSCGSYSVNAGTLTVEKADQEAPSAPTLTSKTATSIQLNTTAGYEYAYRTTNAAPATGWNTTGTFTGLTEYTQYYFFARKAQTTEYNVSPPSPGTSIKTADVTKPTAMVQYQTNDFDEFHNTNTYNLFFKDKADVTIRGADSGSGVNKTEYFKSNTPITDTETITRWVTGDTFSVSTKEKFHLYVRVTDAEDNQSRIYFDSIVVYEDSEQDTASISYTKASAANQTAAVTLNGNTIDSIKNETATLENGTDYSVSGDEITFNASYLEQLAEDDYELTIYYKPQGETYESSNDNDAPATTVIALTVNPEPHTHNFEGEWKSNVTGHWQECSCGETSTVIAHTEDAAATCTTPQTCTVCNKVIVAATGHNYASEWSSDANDHWRECSICGDKTAVAAHTSGDWIIDTLPTQTANGSRHKQCTTCGYITETQTISATGIQSKNKITSGTNQSLDQDPTKEATIICDGAIEDFVSLKVDGVLVAREHYTVISGSTIITIKPDYLKTLGPGDHSIELLYTDGSVQTNLTIQAAENNTETENQQDNTQTDRDQTNNNQTSNNQTSNNQTNNNQATSNNPTVSPHTDDTIYVVSPTPDDRRNSIPWFLLGGTFLITLSVTSVIAIKRRKH